YMLETDADGRSHITRQLDNVPDAELENHALRYLNASNQKEQPELAAAVAHAVMERASRIRDSDLRTAVQEELDVFSLSDRVGADLSIDIDETLERWKNKHHEVSPYVLYLLLPGQQGRLPDALLNEVCVALQKHRKDISRDVMLLASKFTIVISDPEAPTV